MNFQPCCSSTRYKPISHEQKRAEKNTLPTPNSSQPYSTPRLTSHTQTLSPLHTNKLHSSKYLAITMHTETAR